MDTKEDDLGTLDWLACLRIRDARDERGRATPCVPNAAPGSATRSDTANDVRFTTRIDMSGRRGEGTATIGTDPNACPRFVQNPLTGPTKKRGPHAGAGLVDHH